MPLIRALVAFYYIEELRQVALPQVPEYASFKPSELPQKEALRKLAANFKISPPENPPLLEFASGKELAKFRQAREAHERASETQSTIFVEFLIQQWPCHSPSLRGCPELPLLDVVPAHDAILPTWARLYENHQFDVHLREVQQILNRRGEDQVQTQDQFIPMDEEFTKPPRSYDLPRLRNDLSSNYIKTHGRSRRPDRNHLPPVAQHIHGGSQIATKNQRMSTLRDLRAMVQEFGQTQSTIHKKYAEDLVESIDAFARSDELARSGMGNLDFGAKIGHKKSEISQRLATICSALEHASSSMSQTQIKWLKQGRLWPNTGCGPVLELLRSSPKCTFGSGMKEAIVALALAITDLQRSSRIQTLRKSSDTARLIEEQKNPGHQNWNPVDYPDWLLLEIESNFLIRPLQVDVALAIASPSSGKSSVLQLNMGQGKTSCIIPMVASLLADGKSLVRVSVPKALLQQTAQLLHARLGGLIGREIMHIPFSRRSQTNEAHMKLYHQLHQDIMAKRGILLILPEHQLSFKLSGLQRVLDNRVPEAKKMVEVQQWMDSTARDILDESDYTLAVKTQLIYPSGSQMSVDGHPHRWTVIQQVLTLVNMHLHDLAAFFSESLEVRRHNQGGYPFVFFLRSDSEEELIRRLRYDVCQGQRGIIPVESLLPGDRAAINEFLTQPKVRSIVTERIKALCPDKPHVRQTVYLLRGLFVHRILIMCLKKRHGVQYGIHPSRDPVAVPFHAKGVPSEQSEFGHVDVAIILTCLAFYHGGIDKTQTRQALEAVLKSDDPASEYEKWTMYDNFPEHLRDWHSINVDDEQQLSQLWAFVRFNVAVLDFYMNHFVFPKHAKQFKVKLQTNGWDIPLHPSIETAPRKHLTTGFSGTSDNKNLLPLCISQDDLRPLAHTNAEVLTYLLEERSNQYQVMRNPSASRKLFTEFDFLLMLKEKGIRILIDAGAQILEMDNRTLAETWLKVEPDAAALYFDGDRPMIVTRQGMMIPFLASSYVDKLDQILVYLDQAHTRGTDLSFKPNSRAALTLDLGQTKDATVQAAMRLRQLGTTQSVTFFAPPQVDQSIRHLCQKKDEDFVSSMDVIRWLLDNTCQHIESLQPLYYSQGIDYCNRAQAEIDFPNFLNDEEERNNFVAAIRQTERQTLQKLYAPQTQLKKERPSYTGQIASFARELDRRKKGFQDTGQAVHASALQEVEQEREVEVEVEAVRQIKKPPIYTAIPFGGLHKDLESFAKNGRLPAGCDFQRAFRLLSKTTVGKKFKVKQPETSQLLVSPEFDKTVKSAIEAHMDNYMRPVHWVLFSPGSGTAIVLAPEEAELLLPVVRRQNSATHLIVYAAPVTRRMMHFNDLKFYSVPPLPKQWRAPIWLTTELGYFSGRLYFEWFELDSICKILGIDQSAPMVEEPDSIGEESSDVYSGEDGAPVTALARMGLDGTGDDRTLRAVAPAALAKGLTTKPYSFTQEFLGVRRHGQDFTQTPMGFLCQGKPLHEGHAFFRRMEEVRVSKMLAPVTVAGVEEKADEEAGGAMDVGDYDPDAKLDSDEEAEDIEYEDSEVNWGEESEMGDGKKEGEKDDAGKAK